MKPLEMPCIVCPMSCHIEVIQNETGKIISVKNNHCPKGDAYVRKELTHPMRLLTSTVEIEHALYRRCPVMTSSEIPKEKMFDVMNELKKIKISAPIMMNEVILKNVCELNVDIIATRHLERVK